MRLGIFGGTFNPVHLAHLIVAESLKEVMGLDRVLFIPSSLPPHKETPVAGAAHRLAMVGLAAASNPGFEVSDIEIRRGGRSYSIDTLRELSRRRPGDRFFFIVGMDAFADIGTWREAPGLFALTSFLVIPRPGHPLGDPLACLPPGVEGEPAGETTGGARRYSLKGGGEVFVVNVPLVGISSSDIRRRVREGRSIRYLVPEAVASYIKHEGLYNHPEKEAE